MAIPDDELDRMQAAIVAAMSEPDIDERVPDWTTADDLSRIGIEALIDADPLGRRLASRGNIRITVDGVTGSSAKVNKVARVMTGFQRLATAVGAAQTGDKALGKRANADVRRRTDLLLTAAPASGSIVIAITPALAPIVEHPDSPGMLNEFEPDDQMLDTAVGAAIDVFAAGNETRTGTRAVGLRPPAR